MNEGPITAEKLIEMPPPGTDKPPESISVALEGPVLPVIRIEPSRGWTALRLNELWEYRELLYFLAWRDVKIRYKQTALGAAWAVLQPLMTMLVFTLFFHKVAKVPSEANVPYSLMAFTALLPWNYFAQSLSQASNSLVGNANLIRKVYFPRLAAPIAAVLAGIVDFCVAFVMLVAMMVFYRVAPTSNIVFLPLFFVLACVTALGVSMWMSALNVEYRDVRYIIPFLIQFWLFATPVAYPSSLLAEKWKLVYGLNPMAGVVEGFRWALLGTAPPGPMLFVSTLVSVILLVTGTFYFRRMEKTFADLV